MNFQEKFVTSRSAARKETAMKRGREQGADTGVAGATGVRTFK